MWSPTPTVPGPITLGGLSPSWRKLGFFERLRIGWRLTKVSLGVLRKEKGLVLLPFLSFLITVAGWAILFITVLFLARPSEMLGAWFFYVGLAVVYFVTFFVSIYFNAAVMGAAMIRLNGGVPPRSGGAQMGTEKLRLNSAWSLLAATAGPL